MSNGSYTQAELRTQIAAVQAEKQRAREEWSATNKQLRRKLEALRARLHRTSLPPTAAVRAKEWVDVDNDPTIKLFTEDEAGPIYYDENGFLYDMSGRPVRDWAPRHG